MMSYKLVIIACLLAVAHSYSIDVQRFVGGRIIGGHRAKPGQFPYQVSLQWGAPPRISFQHLCGGSILNDRWILTAVHCINAVEELNSMTKGYFIVKAGKNNLARTEVTEQTSIVARYFKHASYQSSEESSPFDIALLELRTPLHLNKRVSPIRLPAKESEPVGDVVLSGWGAVTSDPEYPDYPNILQTITLPIVDRETCNDAVETLAREAGIDLTKPIDNTNICTGPLTGGQSACSGDSGGPLVSKAKDGQPEIVGIVSWGFMPCAMKGAPSVYVRVSSFIDWIDNIMTSK